MWNSDVRFSAPSANQITINSYSPSSVNLSELVVEQSKSLSLIPILGAMKNELWNTLWNSGANSYGGDLLPDFIYNGGPAPIVRHYGWWSIQPGDLSPNTIYLVDGGAQFSGNVDISNVAIITKQGLGVGGGYNLHFQDVFFMGTQLNLAGNITWGPTIQPCQQTDFSVYLFGTQSLSMGGWGSTVNINNVVGAAPNFQPGGAMKGSGLYFESANYTSLGGDLEITACGTSKNSFFELTNLSATTPAGPTGVALLR